MRSASWVHSFAYAVCKLHSNSG